MGATHRVAAAAVWLGTAPALGVQGWPLWAGLGPAVAFSAGTTSPDLDNTKVAKLLDGALPDEALGGCGPLQHRGLAHWVGWPGAAGWLVWIQPVGPIRVLLLAGVVGWASHLVGDALFGQAGYGTRRGVPLAPWGWHVGVGVKVGGGMEWAARWVLGVAAVWAGIRAASG